MKKFFLGFLVLISAHVFGQQRINSYADYKSEHWTMRKFDNDPLNVRYYTFKNGLTLITSVNKRSPRINTMVAVKTGSKNDPATNTGLAHYLEHMLFKGTDKYGTQDWAKEKVYLDQIDALYEEYNTSKDPAQRKIIYHKIDSVSQIAAKYSIANEFDKMCQAMGAEGTNAFTSNDMTVYVNDVPNNMMKQWISLEAERYRAPVLRLFHTELEAVYEEKNISLDRDGDKVWETLNAELFKRHNYGLQTTIGTIEHLKNPSLKAIRNYFNTYYVPNNMAVIMVGDFNPDSAAAAVYEKFSYMKYSEVPRYKFEQETTRNVERSFDVVGPDAENLTIGFRLPGAGSKEASVIRLVDLLLNNSSAGLIDLNLVKKQRVLSANSGTDIMKDYSVFLLTGKPKAGQTLEELKDLLLGELAKIRKGEFDNEQLKAILLNEEISKLEAYKENGNRSYFLMSTFVNDQDYRKSANELADLYKVTKEEIVAVANEYLNNDRVVVYKRKGEAPKANKIDKPEIHPVELNRDKQSDFVKNWLAQKSAPIAPVYFDANSGYALDQVRAAKLYYVKNDENRLFNITIRYEAGTMHDKRMGLMTSYLRLLGDKSQSNADFSKKMYGLACNYSISNDDKHFFVTVSGPLENQAKSIELVMNHFSTLVSDAGVLKNLKEDILKTRENNKLNARAIQRQLSQYAIYGANNPSKLVIKNQELMAITGDDLLKLFKVVMSCPVRMSYYGPSSKEEFKSLLLGMKNNLIAKSAKPMKQQTPDFKERETNDKEVYFVHYEQVQASINWWRNAGAADVSNIPMGVAFNQYFGGDMSSVVFQNIREAKALAYSTYAYFSEPKEKGHPYLISAFVGTQADKFHEAIGAMNELLNKLPAQEDVFELAKQSIVNRIESERILPSDVVSTLWYLEEKGYSEHPNKAVYEKVSSISMKDIDQFHQKYLSNKVYTLAVVGSKDRIKTEDLSKYGAVKVLTLEEIFGY